MSMMTEGLLSVREIQQSDVDLIIKYWFGAEQAFLKGMGVDLAKLPTREQFSEMLMLQLATPLENKRSYCIIWQVDGEPVGHCNTNPTLFGEEAFMHLHLWKANV